jgi:hypothetical protein
MLDYGHEVPEEAVTVKNGSIDFGLMAKRTINEVCSKYPIRQSLRFEVPKNNVE